MIFAMEIKCNNYGTEFKRDSIIISIFHTAPYLKVQRGYFENLLKKESMCTLAVQMLSTEKN